MKHLAINAFGPSHADSVEPQQWLLGGKSHLFFLPRQLSRTGWCHPFLSFKYKPTYPPRLVVTDHRGTLGHGDTICLGDWQVKLSEGWVAPVGLCGRWQCRAFLFLPIGFVSDPSLPLWG